MAICTQHAYIPLSLQRANASKSRDLQASHDVSVPQPRSAFEEERGLLCSSPGAGLICNDVGIPIFVVPMKLDLPTAKHERIADEGYTIELNPEVLQKNVDKDFEEKVKWFQVSGRGNRMYWDFDGFWCVPINYK